MYILYTSQYLKWNAIIIFKCLGYYSRLFFNYPFRCVLCMSV